MQMNGSAKVSAPRCTSYVGPNSPSLSNFTGTFSNGDSILTAAAAAGAESLTVDSETGFPASGTLIVGYGSDHEEEVAFTSGEGIALDSALLKDHAVNERVIVKPTVSLMPGTVVINYDGSQVASDDGAGAIANITEAKIVSGTVDYSTGRVRLVLADADESISISGEALSDSPSAAGSLADGSAAHKTFQQYAFTKNDVPSTATVSNLGDATVGFFFEVSRNGGKSFTSAGLPSSGSVGALGVATVTCPGGQDQVVRFRAGSQSGDSDFEGGDRAKDPEGRIIEPRVVTVDTATNLNHG